MMYYCAAVRDLRVQPRVLECICRIESPSEVEPEERVSAEILGLGGEPDHV